MKNLLKLRIPIMATDENGDEVFMSTGDYISEIEDAGPYGYEHAPDAWNVTCRFTPNHKLWTEIVTIDSVKLLKALEGV